MSVSKTFDNLTNNTNVALRHLLVSYGEKKNIYRKRKLIEKVVLTEKQEKEIKDYFKNNYGRSVPTDWHRLYQSYTGVYNVDYFPEILFSTELEPITNPYREAEMLDDKNLLPILFGNMGGVRVPTSIIFCNRGVYHDSTLSVISREKAVKIVTCVDEYVIKKTINTSSGRDVAIIKDRNIDVNILFEEFGSDFVVQELVHQCKELEMLNSSSVNTFRVITYICSDDVFVCPAVLRMGRSGKDKDNMHYGGICVGVNPDGSLKKTAYSEYGESFDRHPDSHIEFQGYCFPIKGEQLWETAKALHYRVPNMGIVSWDLTIDEVGVITIIEMNTIGQSAWFCQMVNGEPLFGKNTPKMLSIIRK